MNGDGLSRWGTLLLLLGCSGCSFLFERFPPSTEASTTPSARVATSSWESGPRESRCARDGFWNPLFDATWVVGGAAWAVYAHDKSSGTDPVPAHREGSTYYGEQPGRPGDNGTAIQAARIWGYSSMVFFAASAIYGTVVEASCAAYRNRL